MTDNRRLFTELNERLGSEIEAVAIDLRLDPKRRGRKIVCVPPWGSTKARKLEIKDDGRWSDWHTGKWGDALGLVGCVLTQQPDMKTREARREGVRWAKARYGIDGTDFDQTEWDKRSAQIKAERAERRKQEARKLKADRGVAQHVWINAEMLRPTRFNGTVAQPGCAGARYLEARGIDFGVLGRLPRAVKFSPREHWVQYEDGELIAEHYGPALVSMMTLPDGGFGALHRIWIDPENEGQKAALDPPRKMWPSSEGCAIRLWRGEHHLTEVEARAKGLHQPLVICEGVEDGLSIAMMTPEFRVHAAGSLPGLLSYEPPPCASRIIVAADNDWDKPQAVAMLKRAVARLEGFGRPVTVTHSPAGKDFNDLLRGE